MIRDSQESTENLAHFGVKGMHWGHRKGTSESSGSKSKKLSRAEVRQEKSKFYEDKLNNVLQTALKNPESLIALKGPGEAYASIVTGKEFVNYARNNGAMDARMTDVYATKNSKSGPYTLNANINQKYVRSDKRK